MSDNCKAWRATNLIGHNDPTSLTTAKPAETDRLGPATLNYDIVKILAWLLWTHGGSLTYPHMDANGLATWLAVLGKDDPDAEHRFNQSKFWLFFQLLGNPTYEEWQDWAKNFVRATSGDPPYHEISEKIRVYLVPLVRYMTVYVYITLMPCHTDGYLYADCFLRVARTLYIHPARRSQEAAIFYPSAPCTWLCTLVVWKSTPSSRAPTQNTNASTASWIVS